MLKMAQILTFPSDNTRSERIGPRPSAAGAAGSALATLSIDEVGRAVKEGRVRMHYQPQYDLRSGQVRGLEALVRIVDQDGTLVFPDRFIHQLEASDQIVAFGHAVIAEVCRDLADLRQAGATIDRVAVNLCAHQLNADHLLLDTISQNLKRLGLDYADLEFELTERQKLCPGDRGSSTLRKLESLGSTLSLDDFGAGHSSVMCLLELPFGTVKLDRAITSRLPENKVARSLVRGILNLARELQWEVIAEGVENDAQREWLQGAGCHGAQGFGLARPMSMEALFQYLPGTLEQRRFANIG